MSAVVVAVHDNGDVISDVGRVKIAYVHHFGALRVIRTQDCELLKEVRPYRFEFWDFVDDVKRYQKLVT